MTPAIHVYVMQNSMNPNSMKSTHVAVSKILYMLVKQTHVNSALKDVAHVLAMPSVSLAFLDFS